MGCAASVEGDEGGRRRKRRLSERLAGDDNKGGRARDNEHNVGNESCSVSRRGWWERWQSSVEASMSVWS
jgi:hypothetical protein